MIVVLTGGTGGAKFVQGLQQVVPAEELTVVVNTGDDLEWWGLHVSPDIDSVVYALAGSLSSERGWGIEGDTFSCLEWMKQLGAPGWFQLGDRDLATHLRRTQLLRAGKSLSQTTAEITSSFGLRSRVLPMSDDRVETRVMTSIGDLSFQEYFVRERFQVEVQDVRYAGAEAAHAAPGVVEAIVSADALFIAPSNPITSIGPILAIQELRQALQEVPGTILAISPIVGGDAVSGPAAALMRAFGLPVSPEGVAQHYRDFLDVLVIDKQDADRVPARVGEVEVASANIIMKRVEDKAALAWAAVELANARTLKA
ncbi:MAG: 2-phospho-L-lactate transferase [Acidobacteriales bacterium]|nr:2-phospho-L-lactate transferase [Terriglobales bacterium]